MKSLHLSSSRVVVELRGGVAVVRITPRWDVAGRHEYLVIGSVEDVIEELRELAEDVQRAVEAVEELARGSGASG